MKTLKQIITLVLFPVAVFAQEGGAGTGGGNGVGNHLFDFYENTGTKALAVKETQAYKLYVEKIITEAKKKVPSFGQALEDALDYKNWILDSKPISNAKECINSSLSGVKKTVIACQNDLEIRIKAQWFESPLVDQRDKAGLILHETLRALGLRDSTILALTRDLFGIEQLKDTQLVGLLYSRGMTGPFWTKANICDFIAEQEIQYSSYCQSPSDDSRFANGLLKVIPDEPMAADPLTNFATMQIKMRINQYRMENNFETTGAKICAVTAKAVAKQKTEYCE
jgi:hypothetical protein